MKITQYIDRQGRLINLLSKNNPQLGDRRSDMTKPMVYTFEGETSYRPFSNSVFIGDNTVNELIDKLDIPSGTHVKLTVEVFQEK